MGVIDRRQVVAVVPVEQPHPFPVPVDNEYFDELLIYKRGVCEGQSQAEQLKFIARKALDKLQLTTTRADPQPVRVIIYELEAKDGTQQRRQVYDLPTMPALMAMTSDEFEAAQHELMAGLPEAFHPFVRSYAWEHGHSAGYEEVLNYVRDLVHELLPCVQRYDAQGRTLRGERNG